MNSRTSLLTAGFLLFCTTAHSFEYPQRISVAGTPGYIGTVQGGPVESRSISADGRYVAFIAPTRNFVPGSAAANRRNAFVIDRQTRVVENVSVGIGGALANADTTSANISADGRYVAFISTASNLVAGDTNGFADAFVYDRTTGTTVLASIGAAGQAANGASTEVVLSGDGRYAAFIAGATNIVPGAVFAYHAYRRDLVTGVTVRASVDASGTAGNLSSKSVALSPDGRYVAFSSQATNLVAGDTNNADDIFLHDAQAGTTQRVSFKADGSQSNAYSRRPALCADPRYVLFETDAALVAADTNFVSDIYLYDIAGGTTRLISTAPGGGAADGLSANPALSADCQYAVFSSSATNLIAGDSNGRSDVFRADLAGATTVRASLDSSGAQIAGGAQSITGAIHPAVSGDGRYVVFNHDGIHIDPADGNVFDDAFVRDMATSTTAAAVTVDYGAQSAGDSVQPSIAFSAAGRHAAFVSRAPNIVPGAPFPQYDVFWRDLDGSATQRVNVTTAGVQANAEAYHPVVSDDGRYVAFYSYSTNLGGGLGDSFSLDVFVRDIQTGATELASVNSAGQQGNNQSSGFDMSSDARYVVIQSLASNLAANDTNGMYDVYLRDRQTGTTRLVSVTAGGTSGNGASLVPAVSDDGRYVAFQSAASDLVPDDGNGKNDVFLRDMDAGVTTLISRPPGGSADGASGYPRITPDGRYVVFYSDAANLVAGDTNGVRDLFVYDRIAQSLQRASVGANGAQGNGTSDFTGISADGRFVVFTSAASNLVPGDSNAVKDVFVRDLIAQATARLSVDAQGIEGNADSDEPAIAADGHFVVFNSLADNLVAGDSNGSIDLFLTRNPFYTAATSLSIDSVMPAVTRYGAPYVVHVVASADHDTPQGSVSIDDGHGASCVATLMGGSGACTLASFALGDLTLSANLGASIAYAGSAETTTHTVQPAAVDLRVSIDDATDFATGDGDVTYTILVTNDGPDAGLGNPVTTTLPGTLSAVTWTCVPVAPAACGAAGSDGIDDLADLPAGGSVTYTLHGHVAALPERPLVVGVSVAASAQAADGQPGDNAATDTDVVGIFRSRFE